MNIYSESAKELPKLRNSGLVFRHGKRKVCDFVFLTSSGGKFYEFFIAFTLVIPPLTVKNRPCALNRKNTVYLFANEMKGTDVEAIFRCIQVWNVLF